MLDHEGSLDEVAMAPVTAMKMSNLAFAFLETLDYGQRVMCCKAFDDVKSRRDWDFIPKVGHDGLPLRLMTNHQQTLAHMLLAASVGRETYAKVVQIIANESVLRELELDTRGPAAADFRNPGNYYVVIFGSPNLEATWGWRIVGHHVSLNFTVVAGRYISCTPSLLGMEPATFGVMRPLNQDDDLGFELLALLNAEQRSRALIHPVAPPNFVTRVVPQIGRVERPGDHELGFDHYVIGPADREALSYESDNPKGIAASALDATQQAKLFEIVAHFASRVPEEVGRAEIDKVKVVGLDNLHFAWAGDTAPGTPHYYRLQGPSLLIEFENAQSGGNHIHSIWRDPVNDFGEDLVRRYDNDAAIHTPFNIDRVTSSEPR